MTVFRLPGTQNDTPPSGDELPTDLTGPGAIGINGSDTYDRKLYVHWFGGLRFNQISFQLRELKPDRNHQIEDQIHDDSNRKKD